MDKARACRRNASTSGFKGVALALAAVAAPLVAYAADVRTPVGISESI
jgi:hypothetical protein